MRRTLRGFANIRHTRWCDILTPPDSTVRISEFNESCDTGLMDSIRCSQWVDQIQWRAKHPNPINTHASIMTSVLTAVIGYENLA
jgi:hypothetical protein